MFGRAQPRNFETWHCSVTPDAVEFTRRDQRGARLVQVFLREVFTIEGRLPAPAL